jgi:SAM-dependent methyltransferase
MLRDAPATRRNREPILEVLSDYFPERGRVLELGCGTGQHACFFAQQFPGLSWFPTDVDPSSLVSAQAWAESEGVSNVEQGTLLDVRGEDWPAGPFAAAFSANVIHISPPAVTPALIEGVARVLASDGVFVLYGPFKVGGRFTSESNERFEGWLKSLDPSFGVKDLEVVLDLANKASLSHVETRSMPANNFCLVFRKELD